MPSNFAKSLASWASSLSSACLSPRSESGALAGGAGGGLARIGIQKSALPMPTIYIKCFNNGELYIHHIPQFQTDSIGSSDLPENCRHNIIEFSGTGCGMTVVTKSHNKLDHEMGLSEIRLCQYAMDDYHDFPFQMAIHWGIPHV